MNEKEGKVTRKKLSRPAKQVLAYTVILLVCYGLFWAGLGWAAMFYGLLVQYFVLPLGSFVVALLMGLDRTWKERQWWMLLYFGFGYLLMQYGTFDLVNMISNGSFHLPPTGLFSYGVLFALPGMAMGSVIRWGREFLSHPGDPRRPLWAFGLVWGIGVAAQHLLFVVPMSLYFPMALLVPSFPLGDEWLNQVLSVLYVVGPCCLAQVAAAVAGFFLSRSTAWVLRQKARMLPLFGAASMLSVGVGSILVPAPWLGNAMVETATQYLGMLPSAIIAFLLGLIPPALGMLVGTVAPPKRPPKREKTIPG
ncbi:MAG: hypothetical protein ACOYJZ_06700 [Acutalibacter sp.]|jgi:hypothetical protein